MRQHQKVQSLTMAPGGQSNELTCLSVSKHEGLRTGGLGNSCCQVKDRSLGKKSFDLPEITMCPNEHKLFSVCGPLPSVTPRSPWDWTHQWSCQLANLPGLQLRDCPLPAPPSPDPSFLLAPPLLLSLPIS